MSNRFRLYETDGLIDVRRITYSSLLLNDRLDFRLSAGSDRRTLKKIDRELRRRKRHEPATPGGNA